MSGDLGDPRSGTGKQRLQPGEQEWLNPWPTRLSSCELALGVRLHDLLQCHFAKEKKILPELARGFGKPPPSSQGRQLGSWPALPRSAQVSPDFFGSSQHLLLFSRAVFGAELFELEGAHPPAGSCLGAGLDLERAWVSAFLLQLAHEALS